MSRPCKRCGKYYDRSHSSRVRKYCRDCIRQIQKEARRDTIGTREHMEITRLVRGLE